MPPGSYNIRTHFAAAPSQRGTVSVLTSCVKPNTAAITFDDGPWIYMYDIVNTLDALGAKATFFFNGDNYDCIYSKDAAARVKYAFDHNHQVASHTWNHAHLKTLTKSQVQSEFSKTEVAIKKITGAQVAFTRPPFGEYSSTVQSVAAERGQSLVTWDFDSGDSVGKSASQSIKDYQSLAKRRPNNVLTLNHETYESTAHTVLPKAIKSLQGAGYKLVTVAECTGKPAYIGTVGPPTSHPSSCS